MAVRLTKKQEKEIYLLYRVKPGFEIAQEYGMEKHYKKKQQVNVAVYNVYTKVSKHQADYGITELQAKEVEEAISKRRQLGGVGKRAISSKDAPILQVVENVRDKTWRLTDMKLNEALRSKKTRDKISINSLVGMAGMSFDKGQILRGESTQNIAVRANVTIDKDTSAADLIEMALKSREGNTEGNK